MLSQSLCSFCTTREKVSEKKGNALCGLTLMEHFGLVLFLELSHLNSTPTQLEELQMF